MSEATTVEVHNLKKFSHTLINAADKARLEEIKVLEKNGAPVPDSLRVPITSGIFLGRIAKCAARTNDKGEYLVFTGDFEARVNGEVFRTHKMFMPEIVEIELGSAVAGALSETSGAFGGMDFALRVAKIKSDTSMTGYEWTFEHILKIDRPDPFADIEAKIAALQLPSPESTSTESAPPPAQKKGKR